MHHRVTMLASILLVATTASGFAQNTNEIVAIAPDTAPAGTVGLLVTFTLDTDVPPPPPAGVAPAAVTIGDVTGTGISHPSQDTVIASFDLPADTTPGSVDAVVTFSTPDGELVFNGPGAFTITTGGDMPPIITGQPQSLTVVPGASAAFTVTAGNGTIDADDKFTWDELQANPATLDAIDYGGHDDWRLPMIEELFSLIDFRGLDPSGESDPVNLVPFLDTSVFDFAYGDEAAGERVIDAKYGSRTLYVSQAAGSLLFGVNFADGRIKRYGLDMGGTQKTFYVKCVRGNPLYATTAYVDNGDGTVTDQATGLMWSQNDSGEGMAWEDALAWADACNAEQFLGHDDWRLPNVKELQSLVDYTRSPDTSGSAAIDPLFTATTIVNEAGQTDFPYYWSSTTHQNGGPVSGGFAAYVAFGRALGYMNGGWVDVHGAGAQRSDPKFGDPANYHEGHGPQGDAIRIFNFVRLVRDAAAPSVGAHDTPVRTDLALTAAPNPFNPQVAVAFDVCVAGDVSLRVYDAAGRHIATLVSAALATGHRIVRWDGTDTTGRAVASGPYLVRLETAAGAGSVKVMLTR